MLKRGANKVATCNCSKPVLNAIDTDNGYFHIRLAHCLERTKTHIVVFSNDAIDFIPKTRNPVFHLIDSLLSGPVGSVNGEDFYIGVLLQDIVYTLRPVN